MTTTVSSAVATREAGIVNVMWGRKTHFAAILPDHIEVKGFLGTAAAALYGNADLMKAAELSPDSLMTALMRCAALGHQPGTDEFYLTPRKDHGRPKVLGIEGYRGIVERMYRSGAVASVVVREVCAKDYFRYTEGEDEVPLHSFGGQGSTGADFFGAAGSRDRGAMVGVYAYAKLTTGAVSRVVILNRDDVLAARDSGGYKPGDQYSPWNRLDGGKDHPEFTGRSMWWKTAARRLEPWVPTSAEFRREQLRASAAASEAAGPRPAPGTNGHAAPEPVYDAEIVDPADASPAGEPQTPAAASSATPPADPAGEAQPAKASSGQVGIIRKHFERLGYSPDSPDDQQAALRATAKLAGLDDLDDVRHLDQDQAARVIRWLEKCADGAALELLLAEGEASDE